MSFETTIKLVPIGISLLAFAVSAFTFIFNIKKEKKTKTPFLIIDRIELTDESDGGWDFYPEAPSTNGAEFILDSRCFSDQKWEVTGPKYSLFLDSREEIKDTDAPWANLAIITFRNIGHDLISFEIVKTEIIFVPTAAKQPRYKVKLRAGESSKLFLYLKSGKAIEVSLSYIYDSVHPLIKEELLEKKGKLKKTVINNLIPIKINALNVRMPVIVGNYQTIRLQVFTRNAYGEKYKQRIEFTVKGNHYSVESSPPRKAGPREANRL